MEQVIDFLNIMIDSMNTMRDTMDSYFDRAVLWLVIAYFKIKLAALTFSSTIATSIISGIGLSSLINQMWNNIDSQILSVLNYCRVPDAINIILSAFMTRFILNLLPF